MSYLKAALPTQDKHHWGQLNGCSRSLVISDAISQHDGLVVVITPDTLSAHSILQETQFFHGAQSDFLSFPEWETLPYDIFSPHEDIISDRISTLHALPSLTQGCLILPVTTCMQIIPPQEFINAVALVINQGDKLSLDELRDTLTAAGYHHVSQVTSRGEFTVRGSIVDFFPMGSAHPYRVEFFDDEIETIRSFDEEKQTSIEKLKTVSLLPAHEFPSDEASITEFRRRYREKIEGDPNKSII